MDPSIDRPPVPQASPTESSPPRDTIDSGPIPGAGEEGSRRSRIGIAKTSSGRLRWIGLLLLGLIVLPGLPIFGPARVATPPRRIRGVGDSPIVAFAFAPDGATIATMQDWRVALRDTEGRAGAPSFLDHRGPALALAFAPGGRSLAVGGVEPDILLYDLGARGPGQALGMPIRWAGALAFSPDGRILAAASYLDHEILLWDLAAGRERARLRGHESPVTCLAFAPDGRSLASGGESDRAIVLWDPATGRPRRRLGLPPVPVFCLVYSPDGHWLASNDDRDGRVRLWDLEGRREDRSIASRSCHARNSLAFSPDGRMLATAGHDGVVRLWALSTGTELRRVGEPGDRLTGVAFSPDGRMLAATGLDADIRLWLLADPFGAEIPGGSRPTDRPGKVPGPRMEHELNTDEDHRPNCGGRQHDAASSARLGQHPVSNPVSSSGLAEDRGALVEHDQRLGLFPEDLGFGLEAVQEPVERVMARGGLARDGMWSSAVQRGAFIPQSEAS
jgi:Tol biopolymer transport system component